MKLIRSSKCSLKFATKYKLDELKIILTEYGKVCNIFIKYFWDNGTLPKSELLKGIVDLPKDTWLSARLRKVAAREAIDMIIATRERWKNKPNKMVMPVHKGRRMYVSCTIAELQDKETKEFDAWLHISSIGGDHIFDLPIKFHKHFNKLAFLGKRLNSYIITEKYVQFSFEIETGKKKDVFRPGYSTKKRGWGLGLSLSKRIVKDYHKGKIFVKSYVVDEGTTFKIILRAAEKIT